MISDVKWDNDLTKKIVSSTEQIKKFCVEKIHQFPYKYFRIIWDSQPKWSSANKWSTHVCLETIKRNVMAFYFGNVNVTLIYSLHFIYIYVTLEHKTSLKSLGYICSNSQKYIVWVKIIDFSFMPKIIRILSKDHVPLRYFVNFLP